MQFCGIGKIDVKGRHKITIWEREKERGEG